MFTGLVLQEPLFISRLRSCFKEEGDLKGSLIAEKYETPAASHPKETP